MEQKVMDWEFYMFVDSEKLKCLVKNLLIKQNVEKEWKLKKYKIFRKNIFTQLESDWLQ